MTNFIDKKILIVLGCLLIASCIDPKAEIKELNTTQLNDVIETLYIESLQSGTADKVSVENNEKPAPSETLVENIEKNSSNNNQVGTNNAPDVNAESTEGSVLAEGSTPIENASTTDTLADNTSQETDEAEHATVSTEFKEKPLVSGSGTENSATPSDGSDKAAFSGFSKPTTESETKSEIVLKELLAKYPAIDYTNSTVSAEETQAIESYCTAISARLSSVSMKNCLAANHRLSPFKTVNGQPIVVTEFAPKQQRKPLGKILVIGGTHGDELTSVSTAYKWISNLNRFHSGLFHWHIAPALNADGVLKRPATRPNTNGIDINRNLPTPDWDKQSVLRWSKLSKNSRKNPGTSAASEPEAQWIMHEIATFQPDAIVSIHAPYGILDFDSPRLNNAPKNFGRLQLNLLGTYPGSLGNYAGILRKIPVLTLELPNATAMPSQKELAAIWSDMIKWLQIQLKSS